LKDYNSQTYFFINSSVDTASVMIRISSLFHTLPELLRGFKTFLRDGFLIV
jgi:histone deacetylase complex regulatory component SIN3